MYLQSEMSSISSRHPPPPPPTDGKGGGAKGRIAFQTIVYNVVFFDRCAYLLSPP